MNTSVVITGASTGIGLTCAVYLAQRGYQVFGGVRKDSDADKLRQLGPITPLIMDVTDPATLTQAAQEVEGVVGAAGLGGLVNNAGVALPGPLEFTPLSDVDKHFDVNVRGVIATTQAFLPLLRQAKGRIVQMSSMGGRNSVPFFGAYCASKFALEGLSDALRLELRPWGIQVAILEPGAIDTPIWAKSAGDSGQMFAHYPAQAQAHYGKWMHYLSKSIPKMSGQPPEVVAQALEHALSAPRPKTRYVLDNTSRMRALLEWLPTRLRDALMARQFGL